MELQAESMTKTWPESRRYYHENRSKLGPSWSLQADNQAFESSKDYYFFCQSGARALQAVRLLKEHKHINAKALTEGAAQLQKLIATASV